MTQVVVFISLLIYFPFQLKPRGPSSFKPLGAPPLIMSSLEAKIVVLGAQGVGKTSLVMRYCKGAFDPAKITSTVGASFLAKRVVDSDSDTVVRLQIWDTGLSPLYCSLGEY